MSQMLQLFIFFVMMMSVNGAVNVFFIGDSTSHKFYEYLRELCSKSQPDPRAVKDFSNDMYHDPIALICDTRHMHRIGFSMHWGVSDSHYHIAKVNHTSPGDTEYSVANIYTRVAEFQHRTAGGSKSVYIFLSNMWDVKRYDGMTHIRVMFGRNNTPWSRRYEATFEANQSESSWVAEYKANYTKVSHVILWKHVAVYLLFGYYACILGGA